MLKVALTGNIASGKSSVVRVWRELGAHVVDADELARRAVEPDTPALRAIVDRWGETVIDPHGRLDRAALREIVFTDPAERAALEAIVHPRVAALREREHARLASQGVRIAVSDVPLLFEVGLQDEFDVVVLVDAPAEQRIERIVRDRGLDAATARRMVDAQMPAEEKRGRADFVIENGGSMEELAARAREVWEKLCTTPPRHA